MAKNTIPDFDTNDDGNSDIGGIGLTDADSARNLVRGFKKLMSILKLTNNGVAPLDDTFRVRNATDTSKQVSISAANVPVGTARALDGEALYQGLQRPEVTETRYTTSGTHTFSTTSKYFQIEAVGGGGGGGGVDGQGFGKLAAASGGGSGFYGKSAILTKGALTTGAVVIGTGGTGGAGGGGGDGSNGNDTTWTDTGNTFVFGGGKFGRGAVADSGTFALGVYPGPATATGAIIGSCDHDTTGYITSAPTTSSAPGVAKGGCGGASLFGTGGNGGLGTTGSDATGYGSGGGGAVSDVATNFAGGAGAPGYLIVREW